MRIYIIFALALILASTIMTPSPPLLAQAIESTVALKTEKIQEQNQEFEYIIEVEYPHIKASPAHKRFNAYMDNRLLEIIAGFKKDVIHWNQDISPLPSMKSGLYIDYSIAHQSANLVSILVHTSPYFQGAAHPNHYYFSVNYQVSTDRLLELSDLFKPGENYLKTLSKYAMADLNRQAKDPDRLLSDEWLIEGTSAKAENFACFNLTDQALVLTFEPYQVASYAAGTQTVSIPYAHLKAILNPDGPLKHFTQN